MAKWDYTINSGTQLREAIEAQYTTMVVKRLIICYQELLDKLSEEDKEWKSFDIEDAIERLKNYDEDYDDDIDEYLEDFYDLCDDVLAWVEV